MTNAFLANAAGMSLAITLLALLVYVVRRRHDSESLRKRWDMPPALNRHSLILFASILVASVYAGFRLGGAVGTYLWLGSSGLSVSFACGLLALAAAVAWGLLVLHRLRRQHGDSTATSHDGRSADVKLAGLFLLFGFGLACYLLRVGDEPVNELDRYYDSVYEARLNKERLELHKIALTRYPNTVKLEGRDPLSLVAVGDCWRETLGQSSADVRRRRKASGARPGQGSRYVLPGAVGTFSRYTATTEPYDWVRRYLLGLEPRASMRGMPSRSAEATRDQGQGKAQERACDRAIDGTHGSDALTVARFVGVHTALFLLLCALWYLFYRWILNARLVGAPGLFEHLRVIVSRNVPERTYSPRPGLVLDLHCKQDSGEDLASLLHRHTRAEAVDRSGGPAPASEPVSFATPGLRLLLRECPWLAPQGEENDFLPGVKIRVFEAKRGPERQDGEPRQRDGLGIHLSALDSSLSQSASREALLRVIRRLKAAQVRGELAELRIGVDFHSYEALLLKAHNIESEREPMTDLEFTRWAETLMDFSVDLPTDLTREVCPAFLLYECGTLGAGDDDRVGEDDSDGDSGTGLLRGLADEFPEAAARRRCQRHLASATSLAIAPGCDQNRARVGDR